MQCSGKLPSQRPWKSLSLSRDIKFRALSREKVYRGSRGRAHPAGFYCILKDCSERGMSGAREVGYDLWRYIGERYECHMCYL